MRTLAKFSNEEEARKFSFFLKKQGIANKIDVEKNSFSLWVEDEDDLLKAQNFFDQWKRGALLLPEVRVEETPPPENSEMEEEEFVEDEEPFVEEEANAPELVPRPRRKHFILTGLFFLLCILFFLIHLFQSYDWQTPSKGIFLDTPIQNALLYDNPSILQEVNQYLMEHPVALDIDLHKDFQKIPLEMQDMLKKGSALPVWPGLESYLKEKWKTPEKKLPSFPMFEKIRQGQIWRLVSPAFFHENLLHILFNVLWLWVLGKQIESRLSKIKYLSLVLVIALFTNTCQYLMSGYKFLGYSGVIMGLVGFIWMRQKVAPWEGYPLSKSALLFIGIYILSLFVLQFFSFGLEVVGVHLFSANIANTAHISGGILGLILGRFPFFSRRVSEQ